MSSIKLTADSGGGTFELKAPSSGSDARVLTVPDTASGTVLTTTNPKAGNILGVSYGFRTGHLQTTSTSYVDSGITANITPASTSNKVLIQMNILMGINDATSSDQQVQVRILRGVGGTDTEIFTERTADYMRYAVGGGEIDYMIAGQFLQNLDSPSTTNQITYKLQVKRGGGGTTSVWAGSNIILQEVAG